jgi:hypothetical protein
VLKLLNLLFRQLHLCNCFFGTSVLSSASPSAVAT